MQRSQSPSSQPGTPSAPANPPTGAQSGSGSGSSAAYTGVDPGFRLPDAGQRSSEAGTSPANANANANAGATVPAGGGAAIEVAPAEPAPVADTSTRDTLIGSTVFIVLLIVFFFVRNTYVHHLVVRRVAPSAAGSAGWLMFVGLGFVSAAVVLSIMNPQRFLTATVALPLALVGLLSLGAALFTGRR